MNVLDLFSGIGGFSLGLERAGMKTIAFCEIEEFPRKVLAKHWPDVPIFNDVRKLHATDITTTVDLICGGFPCQPFSVAGQRRGANDDRHLWPEYLRLIQEIHPRWVIGENVAGLVSMGLDQVLSDLESEDYSCWTFIIPACAVNAPHRRDRLWIVANNAKQTNRGYNAGTMQRQKQELGKSTSGREISTNSKLRSRGQGRIQGCGEDKGQMESRPSSAVVGTGEGDCLSFADTNSQRLEKLDTPSIAAIEGYFTRSVFERITTTEWITEPGVCPRNDGLPKRLAGRVAKLKALGNSVVPQIPELIGRAIMEIEQ